MAAAAALKFEDAQKVLDTEAATDTGTWKPFYRIFSKKFPDIYTPISTMRQITGSNILSSMVYVLMLSTTRYGFDCLTDSSLTTLVSLRRAFYRYIPLIILYRLIIQNFLHYIW